MKSEHLTTIYFSEKSYKIDSIVPMDNDISI